MIVVRLVLAAVNATALGLVRQAVSRRFGHSTGVFFVLLTCSQFHLPFWMGRTLPNMFALYPGMLLCHVLYRAGLNSLSDSKYCIVPNPSFGTPGNESPSEENPCSNCSAYICDSCFPIRNSSPHGTHCPPISLARVYILLECCKSSHHIRRILPGFVR